MPYRQHREIIAEELGLRSRKLRLSDNHDELIDALESEDEKVDVFEFIPGVGLRKVPQEKEKVEMVELKTKDNYLSLWNDRVYAQEHFDEDTAVYKQQESVGVKKLNEWREE